MKTKPSFFSGTKALLFDLDGTLIDSAPDIAAAANILLERHEHSALSLDAVRSMIGNGIRKLVERAFKYQGVDLEDRKLDELFTEMLGIYADNLTNLTVQMKQADTLLETASAKGFKLGLVTNKTEVFSRQIVSHFEWDKYFSSVVGGDTCTDRKPAPGMLFHACAELGVTVSEAIMIGDSPADIDSAKNAKMKSIAVYGGYTNIAVEELGADLVLGDLGEIISLLKQIN